MSKIYVCCDSLDIDRVSEIKKIFESDQVMLSEPGDADFALYVCTETSMNNAQVLGDLDGIVWRKKKLLVLQYTDKIPSEELNKFIGAAPKISMLQENANDKLIEKVTKEFRK